MKTKANNGLLLRLHHCLTPIHRIHNAAILIKGDKILAVGGASAFQHTQQLDIIELPGSYALPGFIDTHICGAGGYDCMRANTDDRMDVMSHILARHGVTTFLPTTQAYERDGLVRIIEALAEICHSSVPGSVPAGIHIEGPFISRNKHGAHPAKYIRPIDLAEVDDLIHAADGMLKIFSFAPELDDSLPLISKLCDHNIVPAMAHTLAGQECVEHAVEAGARRCSHLYNGMEPLQQRKVGLAAVAMMDDRLWVELIPDGVHIHPGMIDLACRCMASDKIIGISNSTAGAGLKDGVYKHGDDDIQVHDGRSELADGTLAGSVSFLDENFRRLLSFSQLSEAETAACFTLNPARSVGLTDRGEIKPGRRADIIVLNQEHEVQMTVIGGTIVYDNRKAAVA